MAPSFRFRFSLVSLAVAALLASGGCMSPPLDDPARVGPFFVPRNVAAEPSLGGIRRVVVLPVAGLATIAEESAVAMDPVFLHALQEQNRFEVVALSRAECRRRFGASSIGSTAPLPHELAATVQRLYAADAILFIDLTVYRAYHPLALGIRSRLARVDNLHLLWTFDNVFSADDPEVAAAARHFFLNSEHQGVPGDLTPAVLQSPSRFAQYAANATFVTLPPVSVGGAGENSLR